MFKSPNYLCPVIIQSQNSVIYLTQIDFFTSQFLLSFFKTLQFANNLFAFVFGIVYGKGRRNQEIPLFKTEGDNMQQFQRKKITFKKKKYHLIPLGRNGTKKQDPTNRSHSCKEFNQCKENCR